MAIAMLFAVLYLLVLFILSHFLGPLVGLVWMALFWVLIWDYDVTKGKYYGWVLLLSVIFYLSVPSGHALAYPWYVSIPVVLILSYLIRFVKIGYRRIRFLP